MEPFNLIDKPWIPCIYLDGHGQPELLSLRDTLLKAHAIREIYHDSPLTIAALHRLLLAITHRLFGPEDRWAWADLWQDGAGQWDAQMLDDYLAQYHNRFDLFDAQHPFYQVAEFSHGGQPTKQPVSQLSQESSSGNNLVLFDHHSDHIEESISPAEAACRIVTLQAFNIGFGVSHKHNSETLSFRDGPWARGASFLVQGDNLFQTLLLSMRPYPDPNSRLPDDPELDKPAWEMDDPFVPYRDAPLGYLDYLTWQSLQVKLVPTVDPSGIVYVNGVQRIQGLGLAKGDTLDPLKSYRQNSKGEPIVRGFSESRALWRDSAALLEFAGSNPKNTPENYSLLASLVYPARVLRREERFRYLAFGLATEEGKAANVALWRYERMPLPLEYLVNENAVSRLRNALELAEKVSWHLDDARDWLIWLAWVKPTEDRPFHEWRKAKDRKKHQREKSFKTYQAKLPVAAHYWWRLGGPFKTAMVGLAGENHDNALESWRKTLRRAARDAFRETTTKLAPSPQHLRAIAKAENELARNINFVLKVT